MLQTVAFSKQLDAPAANVWQLIIDTWTWHMWGPSIRAVNCLQRFISAGCKGRIQTPIGVWLPFCVTTFQSECFWDWRVAGLAATGHRVDSLGPNRSKLSFTVPVWAVGYGPVCRRALMRIDRLLAGDTREFGA
jgi:hypothetical protein